MMILAFLFSSVVGQLDVLGIPGSETAQLSLLVQQSQQQLLELQKILKTNELTADETKRAVALSQALTEGIDQILEPFKTSKEFQEKLQESAQKSLSASSSESALQKKDPLESEYSKFFPDDVKKSKQIDTEFSNFQRNVSEANSADMKDLSRLDKLTKEAKFGELPRLEVATTSKVWEANLRISAQLTQLSQAILSLQKEIEKQRMRTDLEAAKEQKAFAELIGGSAENH